MSFSWVDPHFTTLYVQREDARILERLAEKLRERATREEWVPPVPVRALSWFEQESEIRSRIRVV